MSDRREMAEALFLELAERGEQTRAVVLAERCAADPQLRSEIEALLECHDGAGRFLDDPLPLGDGLESLSTGPADNDVLKSGTRLGEYAIERLLGEGGMGVVYIARQERPSRTVALKVIRPGFTTPSLLRRFEHEADVLGLLQHPGIAQIFEAGSAKVRSPGGREGAELAYITMELVHGTPLHQYARDHALEPSARMELVAKVCHAVHHAHQRGVIHRDLKPANILVDASGQPKVLDFGVARAADADIRVATLQTCAGQLIGTLPYMSPEQVLANPAEVDTRSDVYALGVILYQLLTDRLPLDLSSRSIPEAARMIRDESPARLSAVSRLFRGDVETIVSKAMEKDKAHRYQSAEELAADIDRYLRGEAIAAKQDWTLYVLRKQLRRHRAAAVAGGVVALSLATLAVYASVQAHHDRQRAAREQGLRIEAQNAERDADAHRARADSAATELAEQLSFSTIDRGRLLTMLGNTLGAEELIWGEYLAHPDSRAAYWALFEVYAAAPIRRTVRGVSHVVNPLYWPGGDKVGLARSGGLFGLYTPDLASKVGELKVAVGTISAVAVSTDGRLVAASNQEGELRVVRLADGEVVGRWLHPGSRIQSLKFTHDGSALVSGDLLGSVRVHEVSKNAGDGHELEFRGTPGAIREVAVSSTGLFAASCFQKLVQVWDRDGSPLRTVVLEDRPNGLVFTPDGKHLLAATPGALLRINTSTWEQSSYPQGTPINANRLSLSDDGGTLLVVGAQVELWDVPAMKLRTSFNRSEQTMLHGVLDPAGSAMIVVEPTGLARLWETTPRPFEHSWVVAPEGWVTGAEFTPDQRSIVTTCPGARPSLGLWAVPTGERSDRFESAVTNLRSVAWSHDGRLVAVISNSGKVTIFDAATITDAKPTVVGEFDGPDRAPALCFDAGSERVFAQGIGGTTVYHMATKVLARLAEAGGNFGAAAALPSASGLREIVAVGGPNGLAVWDLDRGVVVRSARLESFTTDVAVTRDGAMIAHPGDGRDVVVRRADTLGIVATLAGHRERALSVSFSPDGTLLASGGLDGDVHLWDVANTRQLATLRRGRGQVSRVRFSPDGAYLLCTGQDGRVRLLDLNHCKAHIEGNRSAWQELLMKRTTRGQENFQMDGQ